MGATIVVVLIALVIATLNVVATLQVRSSDAFSPSQKRLQYLLIWIVPIIGAALPLAVLMSDNSRHTSPGGGEPADLTTMDGNVSSDHHHGGGGDIHDGGIGDH